MAAPIVNGMDASPRGKMLSAAARLFRDQGFERTTVRDIARETGIQSGSLFHHFPSKEDILFAVMVEGIFYRQGGEIGAAALVGPQPDSKFCPLRCFEDTKCAPGIS